jgi:hypothetical protein
MHSLSLLRHSEKGERYDINKLEQIVINLFKNIERRTTTLNRQTMEETGILDNPG